MKSRFLTLIFLPLMCLVVGCTQIGKFAADVAGYKQSNDVMIRPYSKVELNGQRGVVYGFSTCETNNPTISVLGTAQPGWNDIHLHCALVPETAKQVHLAVVLPSANSEKQTVTEVQLFDVIRDRSRKVTGFKRAQDGAPMHFL